MKKLIALMLILVCSFSLVSCGLFNKDNGDDSNDQNQNTSNTDIDNVVAKLNASKPTKAVVGTTITTGDTALVGEYILITGTIDGKQAATYYQDYEKLISVDESGALDYVTGTVVKEPVYKEYLEDQGVRIDGGKWDKAGENFAKDGGIMALNLTQDLISRCQYDANTKTFSCIIAKDKTAAVLGLDANLTADASIEIVDDGASINTITITYTIPATANDAAINVVIKAYYTYDLEIIKIN